MSSCRTSATPRRARLALIQSGLAWYGATVGPTVRIPLGVTEVGPYVADLTAADVDGVVAFVAAPLQVSLLKQLRDAKYRGDVVVPNSFSDRLGLAMGEEADGTLVVGEFFTPWTKDSSPGLRRFRADLVKHGSALVPNEGAINFWLVAWASNTSRPDCRGSTPPPSARRSARPTTWTPVASRRRSPRRPVALRSLGCSTRP